MPGANRMDYTDCFVAFLDILGMKDLVRRSKDNDAVRSRLERLLNVLRLERMPESFDYVRVRAFSDSVVVFTPSKYPVVPVFIAARQIHDRAMEEECFVRGAITKGGMYWHEERPKNSISQNNGHEGSETIFELGKTRDVSVTFGPALTEAHELECKHADNPRIILGDELCKFFESERYTSGGNDWFFHTLDQAGERFPITEFIRRDTDGLSFLDVLHPKIFRSDIKGEYKTKLPNGGYETRLDRLDGGQKEFKKKVRETLVRYQACATNAKVIKKVRWYVDYFNGSLSPDEIDLEIVGAD